MLTVPPAHVPHRTVGAGTDPPPVRALPVTEVVPAGMTGPAPVADLIPPEAGGGQGVISLLVALGEIIVLRRLHLAAGDSPSQAGAAFDDEGVGRYVVGVGRDRRVQAGLPVQRSC